MHNVIPSECLTTREVNRLGKKKKTNIQMAPVAPRLPRLHHGAKTLLTAAALGELGAIEGLVMSCRWHRRWKQKHTQKIVPPKYVDF